MTRLLILVLLIFTVSGCNSKTSSDAAMLEIPKKPGQVLDPNSQYVKTWPGKPALVKLKDNLVLSIPPQFHQFWTHRDRLTGRDLSIRPPTPIEKLHYAELAGFTMHMPDFRGYSYENYLTEFNQDAVDVFEISPSPMTAIEPGAPGSYPPNQFQRISALDYPSINLAEYEEKYGLRCYKDLHSNNNKQICYGRRASDIEEYLLLDIYVPPHPDWVTNPTMQTTYFSSKYGGIRISWRSNVKNFSKWREIDAQLWKYIDQWNIAPKTNDAMKSTQTK